MRELKFKIWDGEKMKGIRDVNLLNPCDPETILIPLNHKIMQFSGLKDKHNKEIYEGDIIQGEVKILKPQQVTFQYGQFMLGNSSLWGYIPSKRYEVIGNIYENPELIAK